jgi:integrase/recombinase XerD
MNNQELVDKFAEDLRDDLKARTIKNYQGYLTVFSRSLNKPFKEATAEDIKTFFRTADMTTNSKETFKVVVRKFYRWLYHKKQGKYPEQVRDLKVHFKNMKRTEPIRPESILTKEDIAKLTSVATNFRDQAIVAVLYESATRRAEFLGMNIGHINFDQYGAVVMVSGKTGDRRIRLIESVPLLQQWIQAHPQSDKKEAPLWVTIQGEPERLAESSLNIILGSLGKRANIDKPVNPHFFRHSRLTQVAKFLSDGKMKIYAGWTPDSRMNGIYVHLSGKDLDEDFMKAAGIVQQEKTVESPLKPKTCRRCKTINSGPAEYCVRCGLPFDESKLIEQVSKEESEAMQKELENLRQNMTALKRSMFQMSHNLPSTLSDDEIDQAMAEEEANLEKLRKEGYAVRLARDGTFVRSKPNR